MSTPKIYPTIEIDGTIVTPRAGHMPQSEQSRILSKSTTTKLLDAATYHLNEHGHLVIQGCPIGPFGSHKAVGKPVTITMSHFTLIEETE